MSHKEQDLLTFPKHLSPPQNLVGVRGAHSLVFMLYFLYYCLSVCLFFFFKPYYCQLIYDLCVWKPFWYLSPLIRNIVLMHNKKTNIRIFYIVHKIFTFTIGLTNSGNSLLNGQTCLYIFITWIWPRHL